MGILPSCCVSEVGDCRFWTELGELFDKIGSDGAVRAVVLASALPKMFTAGLDCKQLISTFNQPFLTTILR